VSNEYCVDQEDVVEVVEGEVVKVSTLSFLGDVDKDRGVVVSVDSGCVGCSIAGKILVVERFRGSTVGTYVMYSLCRRGLTPKAILCSELDPVVVAGAALCGIPIIYGIPDKVLKQMESGDKVRIVPKGGKVCIVLEKVH
jgi:predicted aconitase with swiveling domain